jgi:hypothetical protein
MPFLLKRICARQCSKCTKIAIASHIMPHQATPARAALPAHTAKAANPDQTCAESFFLNLNVRKTIEMIRFKHFGAVKGFILGN